MQGSPQAGTHVTRTTTSTTPLPSTPHPSFPRRACPPFVIPAQAGTHVTRTLNLTYRLLHPPPVVPAQSLPSFRHSRAGGNPRPRPLHKSAPYRRRPPPSSRGDPCEHCTASPRHPFLPLPSSVRPERSRRTASQAVQTPIPQLTRPVIPAQAGIQRPM